MHFVQALPKYRVQVAIHMGLYAMLTQLAVDSQRAGSVNLAPNGNLRVQNCAERVVAVGQKDRAAALCPDMHTHS